MRIGVLEDEIAQQELYLTWFGTAGHSCKCFGTAKTFLDAISTESFDLFIIDWNVPDSSGEIVLKWIRKNVGWEIPVIFITARDSENDIVSALRTGADDYVVKPANYSILLARIESLGRRVKSPKIVNIGAYEINQDLRQIKVHGKDIDLTQKEFELASYIFQNHGKLLSRVRLLDKLWGLNADVDTRTVDTHVSRIRRKLSISPENGWQILPVYGYGYRVERVSLMDTPLF
jgi:two-component system, OmpR family, response regulator RegX3